MSQESKNSIEVKKAYIALGSNVTSGWHHNRDLITKSLEQISLSIGVIGAASRIYQSPAFPIGTGPDFANAVVMVETSDPAQTILSKLHEIEDHFGRTRTKRWGQRSLDLDLLSIGDDVLPDQKTVSEWMNKPLEQQLTDAPDRLILPHPRLQDRAFVLVPLVEIAPDWTHPILGLSATELLNSQPQEDINGISLPM